MYDRSGGVVDQLYPCESIRKTQLSWLEYETVLETSSQIEDLILKFLGTKKFVSKLRWTMV